MDRSESTGAALDHSPHVIVAGPVYGLVQQYWGEIAGPSWPLVSDLNLESLEGKAVESSTQRLERMIEEDHAEWFFVADPRVLDPDPDLQQYLDANYPAIDLGGGWRAYRLQPG